MSSPFNRFLEEARSSFQQGGPRRGPGFAGLIGSGIGGIALLIGGSLFINSALYNGALKFNIQLMVVTVQ